MMSQQTGTLNYSREKKRFTLNNIVLQTNDVLAIEVLGYWITGRLGQDAHGWFLLTVHQVGIRLRSGLTARTDRTELRNAS